MLLVLWHLGFHFSPDATELRHVYHNTVVCRLSKSGSPQDFVKAAILRGFHDSLDYDEFEVGRGQSLGLQQKVSQVLVATPAVDK